MRVGWHAILLAEHEILLVMVRTSLINVLLLLAVSARALMPAICPAPET